MPYIPIEQSFNPPNTEDRVTSWDVDLTEIASKESLGIFNKIFPDEVTVEVIELDLSQLMGMSLHPFLEFLSNNHKLNYSCLKFQ